ncbi:galactose-1-epimerase [Parasalinivibrio latis]|uniref:galactose-1-epimerase n=1 Tax=Parasalinivibrio latis TaxID=2952610 RepID=UPI0030DF6321
MNNDTVFGNMTGNFVDDGLPPRFFTLRSRKGMELTFMDIGATWLSCRLPVRGTPREVLLASPSLDAHFSQRAYLGSTVGRYANRIAGGRYFHEGKTVHLDINQPPNCLHGGSHGFHRRRWRAKQVDDGLVVFSLESMDGDQGFPGALWVDVRFELIEDFSLCIHYQAQVSKPCPVNLTNHACINLAGAESGETVFSHQLMINARHYLPVDATQIPTGDITPVEGSVFDFTHAKPIGERIAMEPEQMVASGYDHTFLLDESCQDGLALAARLESPDGFLAMEVKTTKPALHLYTGNLLDSAVSRRGDHYCRYAGLALETQLFPDAPNHPEWQQPDCFLKPDQIYHYHTMYRFCL